MDLKKLKGPIAEAVKETLKVYYMLSDEQGRYIEDLLSASKDENELVYLLTNRLPIYNKLYNEIPKDRINKVINSERIIINEKVHLPHILKDENGVGILTVKEHVMLKLSIRANQQKSFKEGKTATDSLSRNVANQVTGDSKSGTFSDTEITTMSTHSGTDILKELLGPGSHDVVAMQQLKSEIMRTGEASIKNVDNDSKNKGSLLYLDQILKSMGIDTNVIETPQ